MAKIKLAEALLIRKQLSDKVKQLHPIKVSEQMFVVKTGRKPAHEGIDDIVAQVPRVTLGTITAEYDHAAKRLRFVDAAIQQANWTTEIEVNDVVMTDYVAPATN